MPVREAGTRATTHRSTPLNDIAARQGVVNGTINANSVRVFPGFSNINEEQTETNFSYDSLQAGLRIEARHGLTMQLAYTWSHEIDEVSNDLVGVDNPFDLRYDRGDGQFDRRHIFNANYVYALPFYKNSSNPILRNVLGGWEFSGITVIETGSPAWNGGNGIRYTGPDTLGLGGGTNNFPDQIAPISYPKTVNEWFSASSFAAPVAPWNDGGATTGFGNYHKGTVVGPGLINFNMSLFKTFALTERMNLEFRFESFNTFNHTEFQNVDTSSADSNFGAVISTYDPRVLQLGAKFSF